MDTPDQTIASAQVIIVRQGRSVTITLGPYPDEYAAIETFGRAGREFTTKGWLEKERARG